MMFEQMINTLIWAGAQDFGIIGELAMAKMFEQERLTELNEELKFTMLCIGRLTEDFNYYRANDGNDLSFRVLEGFKMDKVRLEIQINVLQDWLEG